MTPFRHEKRRSLTGQRVARIYALRKGRCGVEQKDSDGNTHFGDGCGWKFGVKSDYEIDHIIALENGGTDDDENLQCLCKVCHGRKTKDDHGRASDIRDGYTRHVVPGKYRTGRGWR